MARGVVEREGGGVCRLVQPHGEGAALGRCEAELGREGGVLGREGGVCGRDAGSDGVVGLLPKSGAKLARSAPLDWPFFAEAVASAWASAAPLSISRETDRYSRGAGPVHALRRSARSLPPETGRVSTRDRPSATASRAAAARAI